MREGEEKVNISSLFKHSSNQLVLTLIAHTGSIGIGNCTCPENTWLDAVSNKCVGCAANSTSSAGVFV
jgi:hypothetical protein